MNAELLPRIQKIKLLMLDNDGVLTDGRIILGDYGDELKFFDVQDGFGMVLLRRMGLRIVIVSGKKSRINNRRAKDLKVDKLFQGVTDKLKVFEKMAKKYRLGAEEICYVGDDLLDLPPMRRAGLAVAVANAVEDVKKAAHHVTVRQGGRGAVREVIDMLLQGQNLWAQATERYFR